MRKKWNYIGKGGCLQHRLIMEKHIGRKLTTNEVVHHIDNNGKNNNIKNLQLMSKQKHNKHHGQKRRKYKTLNCPVCKKQLEIKMAEYRYRIKKGRKNFFCSRVCNGKYTSVRKHPTFINFISYEALIKKGLSQGLTGYAIAKKHNLNKKTVYNKINKGL